jgi:site-specific DNA-methyltransferase (adenine-specific)
MTNGLYYGDNLDVLRASVGSESVDLVYLDPPFNSNASYNVLFKAPSGAQSPAQIEAFDDTWHWNESAERAFDEVLTGGHSDAAIMLKAMRSDGLSRHDGRAADRIASRAEADRFTLSALRPDREPLS